MAAPNVGAIEARIAMLEPTIDRLAQSDDPNQNLRFVGNLIALTKSYFAMIQHYQQNATDAAYKKALKVHQQLGKVERMLNTAVNSDLPEPTKTEIRTTMAKIKTTPGILVDIVRAASRSGTAENPIVISESPPRAASALDPRPAAQDARRFQMQREAMSTPSPMGAPSPAASRLSPRSIAGNTLLAISEAPVVFPRRINFDGGMAGPGNKVAFADFC